MLRPLQNQTSADAYALAQDHPNDGEKICMIYIYIPNIYLISILRTIYARASLQKRPSVDDEFLQR